MRNVNNLLNCLRNKQKASETSCLIVIPLNYKGPCLEAV